MAIEFDNLNDDCIRLILLNFSPAELLALRLIATRWQTVVEVIFRSTHSLKLFPNAGRVHAYVNELLKHNLQDETYYQLGEESPDELIGHVPDGQMVPSLPTHLAPLFPNLTKLILVLTVGDNTDLNALLEGWTASLEELTLVGNGAGYEPLAIEALSSMGRLVRLELFNFDLSTIDVAALTPVLGRLEHFALHNYVAPPARPPDFLEPPQPVPQAAAAVVIPGPGPGLGLVPGPVPAPVPVPAAGQEQVPGVPAPAAVPETPRDHITPFLLALDATVCRRLTLSHIVFSATALTALAQARPNLLGALTHLTFSPRESNNLGNSFGLTVDSLAIIVQHCTALTFFQSSYLATHPFDGMFRQLARLAHLTELKMYFSEQEHLSEANLASIQRQRPRGLRHLQLNVHSTPPDEVLTLLVGAFPDLTSLTLTTLEPIRPIALDANKRLVHYSLADAEERFLGARFTEQVAAFRTAAHQAARPGRDAPAVDQNLPHHIPTLFMHPILRENPETLAEAEQQRRREFNNVLIAQFAAQLEIRIAEIQRAAERAINEQFENLRNIFMNEWRVVQQNRRVQRRGARGQGVVRAEEEGGEARGDGAQGQGAEEAAPGDGAANAPEPEAAA